MAFTTIPAAGAKVRGAVLSALITELRPIVASKSSLSSKTSNAALAADADLVVSLAANASYDFEVVAFVTSAANAAGDIQFGFTFPAGATVSAGIVGLVDTLASGNSADAYTRSYEADSSSPIGPWSVGCSTSDNMVRIRGRITLAGTAGSLTLTWAQSSSNVNATSLLGGSMMTATRVG